MPGKPILHKSKISNLPQEDAFRELDLHQDRVRLAFNDKRTYLHNLPKMLEAIDGELLYSQDGELFLCVKGEYKRVYPVEKVVPIPTWFMDYIYNLEDILKTRNVPPSEWMYYGGGV
jgi:hypothetical protein